MKIDLICVSEPNKWLVSNGSCLKHKEQDETIYFVNRDVEVRKTGKGKVYTFVNLKEHTKYSVYISPNVTMTQYEQIMNELMASVRDHMGKRWEYMVESLVALDLLVLNRGGE